MLCLCILSLFLAIGSTSASGLKRQATTTSNIFPTDASQPIPSLFSSDIANAYFPPIVPGPGDLPDNIPPSNETSGNFTATGNWVGTSLYGYNECRKRGFGNGKINDAYYDSWKLTNCDGIMRDIDWNSASALEFLGPPANNQRYQSRIQDLLDKAASVIYSSKNPFVHHIHVRCDGKQKGQWQFFHSPSN